MISIIISKTRNLHSLNLKRLGVVVSLIGVSYCVPSVQAEGQKAWSRGFSAEPANSADRACEFVLYDLSQEELHLIGRWSYTNGTVSNKAPARVVIEGTKTPDGTFWPDVRLEVRKKGTGDWKTITKSSNHGRRATVIIEPNAINFDLAVNLDAFKSLIGKYESGRIVLKTNRASEFKLADLLPPEQEAKSESKSKF